MAIEHGIAGFESGSITEVGASSTGAGTSSLNVLTSAVRNDMSASPVGSYGLHVGPAVSSQRWCALPGGTITGTTGTVTTGNNKRLRVRVFVRLNTFPNGSSPNQNRIFGSGSFDGNSVVWCDSTGHLGLSQFAGSPTFSTHALTSGVWYCLTLDILMSVSSNTQLTSVLTIQSEDQSTTIDTLTLGPTSLGSSTDELDAITFGDSGGDHNSAYSVDFDDVVWGATSNSDATGAITLPTQTVIAPVSVVGASANQWELGSVGNVEPIPANTSGTGLGSAKGAGTEVDLEFQQIGIGAGMMQIGTIIACKVFAVATQTPGSGNNQSTFNGVTNTLPVASGTFSNGAGMIAYMDWNTSGLMIESVWNNALFKYFKETPNTVTSTLYGVSAEILFEGMPDPTPSGSLSPNSGPTTGGTTVTITGVGFRANTQVVFDQTGAAVTSRTDTTIICTTPRHAAGPVNVTVTTPTNTADPPFVTVLTNAFTFIAPGPGFITLNVARRDPEVEVQNQLGNGQSSFTFSLNGSDMAPYQAGASVDMQLGTGETIARGVILQTTLTVEEAKQNQRLDVQGNDNTWVLNAKLVVGTWINIDATTVATEILNTFAPDFSTAGVETGLPLITVAFYRDVNVGQALDTIVGMLSDGHWYLDDDNVVHLFSGEESGSGITNPHDVTDSDTDLLLAEYPIQIQTDVSQIRNRVYVRGSGDPTSTGYLAPLAPPQGDPGGAPPYLWNTDGIWGSLLETGGNIDTNRNLPGLTWYWKASYAFVWTTASGDSLALITTRFPTPTPLAGQYTTGSNQIGWALSLSYANYDSRITGLKIYRELQEYGPHGLNAAAYGNTDLYSPNAENGYGPFFLLTTIARASLPIGSRLEYLDTASEDTLVGGAMETYEQLVGQDHTANIFAQEDDTAAQATLAALLGYGDGVREELIDDTTITTEADAEARANAELALWANPIVTVVYATRDPNTIVGRQVHFNLTTPAITGDFKIQQVQIEHIHENDTALPFFIATASSVRFTLDDLFARVLIGTVAPTGGGGSSSLAVQVDPAAQTQANSLTPGRNINGVFFDATSDITVPAAMDHMGETPTGTINGTNTTFTTAASYKSGKIAVFRNGVRQKVTVDYIETTPASGIFNFVTAPSTGDGVMVDYESA